MKKLLIVDDSLFMRQVLKNVLSKEYDIVEADSGARAIEQYEKEKPALVLLDIIMPEGEQEGVRVLRHIMDAHPDALVVMITALGQNAIMEECRKLGAKDYIVKPFDTEQIAETVARHLGAVPSY